MGYRSLLFVPGDRPERFAKAVASGADALILDLEDSVAPDAKPVARRAVAEFLAQDRSGPALLVRVNPLGGGLTGSDLAALARSSPDGLMLPKAEGAASIAALDLLLAKNGIAPVPILPIAAETPSALFTLGSYAAVSGRLMGLTWGAEDLPAAIGASTAREEDGRYTSPIELARSLTLFAAHAVGVDAIETVFPAFRDVEGLACHAARGRRDGFGGMMAIHPAQVPAINTAFTLSEAELDHARAVVGAFDANPGAGVLQLDGVMIDTPHLTLARKLLARGARSRTGDPDESARTCEASD